MKWIFLFLFYTVFLIANDEKDNYRISPLITPKNIQLPFQSLDSIYQRDLEKNQQSIFNPLTGKINEEKLNELKQEISSKKKKENEKMIEKYQESSFRRANIIFFMTLPFSVVLSYFIATQLNIQKKTTGSFLIFGSSLALSFLNVSYDKKSLPKNFENSYSYKLKHKKDFSFEIASKRF